MQSPQSESTPMRITLVFIQYVLHSFYYFSQMPIKYWHIESQFHYILYILKIPHNFWTKFGNSDRNGFIRTPQIFKDQVLNLLQINGH